MINFNVIIQSFKLGLLSIHSRSIFISCGVCLCVYTCTCTCYCMQFSPPTMWVLGHQCRFLLSYLADPQKGILETTVSVETRHNGGSNHYDGIRECPILAIGNCYEEYLDL